MNMIQETVNALDVALDAVKVADGGDPATETGWRSDEMFDAWCTLRVLRRYFLDQEERNGTDHN